MNCIWQESTLLGSARTAARAEGYFISNICRARLMARLSRRW